MNLAKSALHKINPTKRLGQNFLIDLNIAQKIIKCSGNLKGKKVIEIGPGTGALTRLLLETDADKVVAIEYDQQCVNSLRDLLEVFPQKFKLIHGDALKVLDEELSQSMSVDNDVISKVIMISNLPYNISVILLLRLLKRIHAFESLTLMFQYEVALRIVAKPNTKDYGIVSVLTQYLCDAKIAFNVSSKAFFPSPKIESTVVMLEPKIDAKKRLLLYSKLEKTCKCLFNKRRKMIRATLKSIMSNSEDLLQVLKIKPESRPEDLTVEDFERLARCLDD